MCNRRRRKYPFLVSMPGPILVYKTPIKKTFCRKGMSLNVGRKGYRAASRSITRDQNRKRRGIRLIRNEVDVSLSIKRRKPGTIPVGGNAPGNERIDWLVVVVVIVAVCETRIWLQRYFVSKDPRKVRDVAVLTTSEMQSLCSQRNSR